MPLHVKTPTPLEDLSPQYQDILLWLEKKGKMTGLQCIKMLGILNYKGRVFDLREAGYDIRTDMVERINRHQRKVYVAEYKLNSEVVRKPPVAKTG